MAYVCRLDEPGLSVGHWGLDEEAVDEVEAEGDLAKELEWEEEEKGLGCF